MRSVPAPGWLCTIAPAGSGCCGEPHRSIFGGLGDLACSSLIRNVDAVAGPAHGLDQLDWPGIIDLAAQPANVYIYYVGGDDMVVIPQVLLGHLARDQVVGMTHQVFEDGKLLG